MDYSWDWFFLGWWPLLFSLVWWGHFPGMGCMIPQPFAAGGNRLYAEFWAITGDPQYPGYFTPTPLFCPSWGHAL
jgi:hypothetical protein